MSTFDPFRARMETAGLPASAIRSFQRSFQLLESGAAATIPEDALAPAEDIPRLVDLKYIEDPALTGRCVMIKLNGGLGTSMGLEKPKSLLRIKDRYTFLDLIARQAAHLRSRARDLRFLLMNSYSTSRETAAFLQAENPGLGDPAELELMQNRVPKVLADTHQPLDWPDNPDLEWCPPGHGDIYTALDASGWLDRLLDAGIRYAFVSNSDNLGATLDPSLLAWFANSGAPFLMEVTRRTAADRKGGHLARRRSDNQLVLRESAQCPEEDEDAFQDIERHRYFNTNNLWLRLQSLRQALDASDGVLPLPVMQNRKSADPRQPDSPAVLQLETAMGAAIECFPGSVAVEVDRRRFAPVKTTSDLLTLRSDAYHLTPGWRLELVADREGTPPAISLDPAHYRMVDHLEAAFGPGAPSLKDCRSLTVEGSVRVPEECVFRGDVVIRNTGDEPFVLAPGVHENTTLEPTGS